MSPNPKSTMAAENFINDLSRYLFAGNLSDLTLAFGEKTWQIHKALACCYSTWFQKAVTSGFKESQSGAITLNDEPEFANAIECMVSYFYNAGYDVSQYDTSGSLLHAQVAIIADKYDCASLYKLAKTSFAKVVNGIEKGDWVTVATFVYDHTTIDSLPYRDLRRLVTAAVANRPNVLKSILEMESTPGLLRSTLDLATDLLLSKHYKSNIEDVHKHIFQCGECLYAHVGSKECTWVDREYCPICEAEGGVLSAQHSYTVGLKDLFSCPSCDGAHTE
ncbi:BTB POZ domain-containing [Pyrenophora seminiperda CCB06]|uniref:BTB POZ domain-containing n=1 Tax=Pyrenophora seminiperda CCB06 TaxID=1302712 RepID=A0A3M7M627_9PLEO|nr:BTB POZ domain-containing [Pyrenophora seminiperda CCB06]